VNKIISDGIIIQRDTVNFASTKMFHIIPTFIGGWFVIQHSSGFGVRPKGRVAGKGAVLVLGSKKVAKQDYVFVWTAKNSIKHVISGMCVNMRGAFLVLDEGCDSKPTMRFQKTGSGFKNIATTTYVAAGSNLQPLRGTPLTGSKIQTAGAAFQFKSKD
jgi:hypothetical protein